MANGKQAKVWWEFKPSISVTAIRVGDPQQGQAVINKYMPNRVFKTRTSRARSHR